MEFFTLKVVLCISSSAPQPTGLLGAKIDAKISVQCSKFGSNKNIMRYTHRKSFAYKHMVSHSAFVELT